MFNCNNLTLLTFTYYLKLTLGILMTIFPFILCEKIYIQTIKYKKKNNRIDKYIIKKDIKNFIFILMIFILSLTLHNTLNTNDNKCYMYANKEILNKYKDTYKALKDENINDEIKNKYLDNVLIVSYNNFNNKKDNKLTLDSLINTNNDYNDTTKLNNIEDNFLNETDLNQLNKVYVKDGVFYYPKYISGVYNSYSGTSCPSNPLNEGYNNEYGYNNYFYTRLTKFIEEANKNGYKITYSSQGCRSYNTQVHYYNTMTRGRAAYPGYSRHGYGIASDLEFYYSNGSACGYGRTESSCPSMGWAHQNAHLFGLTFPLLNASYKEDWHIEPINISTYE